MHKILIKVKNDTLVFSIQKKKTDETNLNNTNVVNTQSIIFTDDYIIENLELVSAFLNVIILKYDVTKVTIKDVLLTKLVLNIINNLPSLKELTISQNENITSDIADAIYDSKHLTYLNCYNISNFMFEKLNKKLTVSVRCELLFISDFMKNNNITTHSDIYYKKTILIDSFKNDDLIDLETFLKTNKKLKCINIKNYDGEKLKQVIKLLITCDKKNIKINIYEENENINESIEYLKKIQNIIKKNKIKLNIVYSDEYKEKYLLKQINLNLITTCLSILVIIVVGIFIIYNFFNLKQDKEIETIQDTINEVVENENETKEIIPSANVKEENDYTKEYSKVFSELKKINDETVGWLKVNNTNVDYPIVKHSDNDYYLNHSFSKKTNINGWLFADYRNNINQLDANTIIYGHNDGNIMFGSLKKVLNKEWYTNTNNHIVTFNTETNTGKWKIFSIYTTPVTSDYLLINFNSTESHTNFLNNLITKSVYNFNTQVTANDKILTLSTCYENSDNRLVIHAKKIS